MLEVTAVFQDSDCPVVIVWTKNGHVENSWGVDKDTAEVWTGNQVIRTSETKTQREATDEERRVILEAFEEWKQIGNWQDGTLGRYHAAARAATKANAPIK
jgi:hypothetical protein